MSSRAWRACWGADGRTTSRKSTSTYFSARTLSQLACAAGFAPLHLGTIGHCWSTDEILRRLPGARFAGAIPGVARLAESDLLRRVLAQPISLDVGDLLFVALRGAALPPP